MKLITILNMEAPMIVCLCRGVSDRVVRLAAQEGARTLPQVAKACGAGRGCGGCHQAIREIVETVSSTEPRCLEACVTLTSAGQPSAADPR